MNLFARSTPVRHPAAGAAIPVNIVTGALGAGKTTVIANLLANKPDDESWLVILNEFTDTGIDTLTLAAAARGAYDVRMIPGGCLCCTGEEDFRGQLSGLLAQPSTLWPARILIEPSGIGHPGAMVDELRLFERGGALRLHSTIALLGAQRTADLSNLDELTRAQVDAADVLLLSKAELVDVTQRNLFMQWGQNLFPRKRLLACIERGVLPAAALSPSGSRFSFEPTLRPEAHQRARQHAHAYPAAPQVIVREVPLNAVSAHAKIQQLLGREACGWVVPSSILFDLPRLKTLLAEEAPWQGVERFKALLRTGMEQWHLLQRWGSEHAVTSCNWSPDNRIELQLAEGASTDWSVWDQRWQALGEYCPVG